MSTHVTTQNLVRSDVAEASADRPATRRTSSRGWAYAGIGAGLAGIGTIVTSSMVNAVYDKDIAGDPAAIMAKLEDQTGAMYAFHTFTAVGAVLLLVFAAGLYRRLRAVASRLDPPHARAERADRHGVRLDHGQRPRHRVHDGHPPG